MPLRPLQIVGLGLLGAGLLVLIAPVPASAADPKPADVVQPADAPGTITPRIPRRVVAQDEPVPDRPVPDAALEAPTDADDATLQRGPAGVRITPRLQRDDYRTAYHAVPFDLAEHQANPGYRHAAAMKFLTGEYPPAAANPQPVAPPAGVGPAFGAPAFGTPGFGPPPFVFDRVQGMIPTFVDRYPPPRVYLPGR